MKSPAFSLYVRDILCSKTFRALHETPGVRGLAYFYLLCEAWLETPPATLPYDHNQLAAMARVSRDEWKVLWPLIEHQFEFTEDGRLYNPRLFHTWELQQKNRRNGQLGGRPENPNRNPNNNPNRKAVVADADADAEANSKRRGGMGDMV